MRRLPQEKADFGPIESKQTAKADRVCGMHAPRSRTCAPLWGKRGRTLFPELRRGADRHSASESDNNFDTGDSHRPRLRRDARARALQWFLARAVLLHRGSGPEATAPGVG